MIFGRVAKFDISTSEASIKNRLDQKVCFSMFKYRFLNSKMSIFRKTRLKLCKYDVRSVITYIFRVSKFDNFG